MFFAIDLHHLHIVFKSRCNVTTKEPLSLINQKQQPQVLDSLKIARSRNHLSRKRRGSYPSYLKSLVEPYHLIVSSFCRKNILPSISGPCLASMLCLSSSVKPDYSKTKWDDQESYYLGCTDPTISHTHRRASIYIYWSQKLIWHWTRFLESYTESARLRFRYIPPYSYISAVQNTVSSIRDFVVDFGYAKLWYARVN